MRWSAILTIWLDAVFPQICTTAPWALLLLAAKLPAQGGMLQEQGTCLLAAKTTAIHGYVCPFKKEAHPVSSSLVAPVCLWTGSLSPSVQALAFGFPTLWSCS